VQFDQTGVRLAQAPIIFGQAAQAGLVCLGDGADARLASFAPGEHRGRMARAAGLGAMARWIPAARLNLIDGTLHQFAIAEQFVDALRVLGRQTIQDLALMASMVRRHRGALPPITVTRRSHKAYLRSTSLLVTDVRPDVQQKSKAMQQSLGLEEAAMDVRSARPASAWDSFIASSTIA